MAGPLYGHTNISGLPENGGFRSFTKKTQQCLTHRCHSNSEHTLRHIIAGIRVVVPHCCHADAERRPGVVRLRDQIGRARVVCHGGFGPGDDGGVLGGGHLAYDVVGAELNRRWHAVLD